MRKFMQWGLVTFIASGLILILAHQILTATTGRTRDVSVAVLEEKLVRLQHEREAVTKARGPADVHFASDSQAATTEELRNRWRDFLEALPVAHQLCPLNDDTLRALYYIRYEIPERSLTEEEREQTAAYIACMADVYDELSFLCKHPGNLYDLFNDTFGPLTDEFLGGFQWLEWLLHVRIAIQMESADHAGAIDSLCLLMRVVPYGGAYASYGHAPVDLTWWGPIRAALADGEIDTAQWERLLQELDRRRQPLLLQRELEAWSKSMISHYERWPESLSMRFSDSPLRYAQNWSYKRITTPLFNHDLARFSEAMTVLLDIAKKPYYLAKPELESFYDSFDVERGLDETKFVRQNPAWRAVIATSRDRFVREAYTQATTDVARVAILLDRYHRDTGAYPKSLEALSERSGVAIPLNPLDGQPYLYWRDGDGFVLGFRQPENSKLHDPEGARLEVATFWDDTEYEHLSRYVGEQMGDE